MQPDISVIVPLYNEEDNVDPLYAKLSGSLGGIGKSYEIVLVDDGSADKTFATAEALTRSDPRLRVVKFKANFGQTPAMAAGIDVARGNILITMDGDLQNDPADIPEFLEKIDSGFDIVVGWRHKRKDKLITRKIPSKIANWIIGKVTGVPIKDNGCSLKAYRASVIKNVPLYSEMHRFIPAMTSLSGARVAEIKVRHHARQHGVSKYGLSRVYKVVLDLIAIKTIIGFSGRPLRWFAKLSLPFGLLGVACVPVGIHQMLVGQTKVGLNISGLAFIMVATASFLAMLGVLGELIFRSGDVRLENFAALTKRSSSSQINNNVVQQKGSLK